MIDRFYTPDSTAIVMMNSLPAGFCPHRIVDFTAGAGSLLAPAAQRWPEAKIYANDISRKSANDLIAKNPSWSVSCSNFLSARSRARAKFQDLKGRADLILLNPPFSQRGLKPALLPGSDEIRIGQAALFVHISLNYLAGSGYLVAILPDGCLHSDRDRNGWDHLLGRYDVDLLHCNRENIFKGVRAKTSIVRIRQKDKFRPSSSACSGLKEGLPNLVVRGLNQMHSLLFAADGLPLVHTSELQKGVVSKDGARVIPRRAFSGPALVFPRVGRTTADKVCVLDRRTVALSDCVLALPCSSFSAAKLLRRVFLENWDAFARSYNGTGAPYITVCKANEFVASLMKIHPRLKCGVEQHSSKLAM